MAATETSMAATETSMAATETSMAASETSSQDLETVNKAIGVLESPKESAGPVEGEEQKASEQSPLNGALAVALKLLNKSGLDEQKKAAIKKAIEAAQQNIQDEENRQFLINYLTWCKNELNAQQNEQRTVSASASLFSSTPVSSPAPAPAAITLEALLEQAHKILAKDPVEMATKESGKLLEVVKNEEFLKENNLAFTPDKEGKGGTLTPANTKDGEKPAYSARFTPNKSGGFNATVTGDVNQGAKAVFKTLAAAGVKETFISGKPIETDQAGYNILKQAMDHNITPVLVHKGVYGSVELFAQQGEKENTKDNEVETRKYLESVVGNDKLRPQLIDDMVKANLVKEDKKESITNEELVKIGLEDVMSKAKAAAEADVKISPANTSEATELPSAPKDNSMLDSSADKKKMELKPTASSAIDEENKENEGSLVRRSFSLNRGGDE